MAAVILQVPNCHEHNKTKINFLFLSLRYQCGIFTTTRTCLIVNIFYRCNEIAICYFKRVLGWTCFYPGLWAVEFKVSEYLCKATF